MDEQSINAEMRLFALEGLVSSLLAVYCLQLAPSDPLSVLERVRQQLERAAQKRTFPQVDPAMSDLLSSELEAAASRLLTMARNQIRTMIERDQHT
jgi:hypothetical protein